MEHPDEEPCDKEDRTALRALSTGAASVRSLADPRSPCTLL